MRILVTGAAGFIGSNFTDRLLASGHEVLGLDDFNDFYDPALKARNLKSASRHANFELVRGDILDAPLLEALFARFRPERVVHLAAWAGVRPSIARPALYQKVNVEGTTNLLERCRLDGVRHFVFASSSSVYGDREQVPFRETDEVDHPISPYAATKKAGELLCYTWHHLFGLNTACLRFFTVYGPRQRPEMAIHQFIRRIDAGEPVQMFGDGSTSRDYTFVDDIVDGIEAALFRSEGYRIYNLGESKTITLRDLIALIGRHVGREPLVERRPLQPGDVTRTFADVARARAELGYDPKVNIDEGIRRMVEWFRADRADAGT
ncbi:GDP-mannose 4,6-dehydratase [Myxococcota bacterium]|jgi:UDP-glucuronate 4-epimerase|nr:GDP-mannose 4,6-dehydratase [Myxococcota bacterium]